MNLIIAAPWVTSYSLSLRKSLPFIRNVFESVAGQNILTVLPFLQLQQSRDGRNSLRRRKRSSEHRLVSECSLVTFTSVKYAPTKLNFVPLYPKSCRIIVYIPPNS